MRHKKIISFLETHFPTSKKAKNDISGFQFGDLDDKFLGCLLVTDVTFEAINFAIEKNLNLIITHHPILYPNPVASFESSFLQKKFFLLEENKITVYTLHTSLDMLPNGLNYHFANFFFPLKKIYLNDCYAKINKKTACEKLVKILKKKLKRPVRYFFSTSKTKNICFISGAGGNLIPSILKTNPNVDTFVTGDLKFSDFIFAKDEKINVIDVGHEIEILLFKNLFFFLKEQFLKKKFYYLDSLEILVK